MDPIYKYYKPWFRASEPDFVQYLELASDYNTRKLTYAEDRPDAFAGITSWMAPVYGPFAFGIPTRTLHLGLLWHPPGRWTFNPVSYRRTGADAVPSWSWMGWESEIQQGSWRQPAEETVMWSFTGDSSQRYITCSTFCIFLPTVPVLLDPHIGYIVSKNDWDVVLDGPNRAVGLIRLNVALARRSGGNTGENGTLSRAGLGWVEAEFWESRRLAKKSVTLG